VSLKKEVTDLLRGQRDVVELDLDRRNDINARLRGAAAVVLIPNVGRRESSLNLFDAAKKYGFPIIGSDTNPSC
jgi:hypothetical protein